MPILFYGQEEHDLPRTYPYCCIILLVVSDPGLTRQMLFHEILFDLEIHNQSCYRVNKFGQWVTNSYMHIFPCSLHTKKKVGGVVGGEGRRGLSLEDII